MEWTEIKENLLTRIKKQRYLVLFLILGIFLMAFPSKEAPSVQEIETDETSAPNLEQSLTTILSQISGAGKVAVLLTEAVGEERIYQVDENISDDSIRRDTILVGTTSKEETGLVRRINPPVYRGAIILCQGADNASVRLSIVQAVMGVTGLTSDHITVLKMK